MVWPYALAFLQGPAFCLLSELRAFRVVWLYVLAFLKRLLSVRFAFLYLRHRFGISPHIGQTLWFLLNLLRLASLLVLLSFTSDIASA